MLERFQFIRATWQRAAARLAPARPTVTDAAGLAVFLAREAAFVAQKSTTDFCRLRAGLSWDSLGTDTAFGDAMIRCRWESYAAVLADLGECSQVLLRRHDLEHLATPSHLGPILRRALYHHGIPQSRPDWQGHEPTLERRLAHSLMAAPRPVQLLATTSGNIVFELLPLQTALGKVDREIVTNSIRFLMCAAYQRMEQQLDLPALARALEAGPAEGK